MDAEGLLILTNDGDLIYRVTHPRFHVKKVYHVKTTKPLAAADARVMTGAGVESDGQTLRALSIKPLDGAAEDREGHWSEIELGEGRKRHIRRMLEGGGYAVVRLKRVRFGPVRLEGLSPGAIRPLTDREIDALRAVGHRIKEAGR